MKIHFISRRFRVAVFTTLVLASACTDIPTAPARTAEPVRLTTDFVCAVDVAAATASCHEAGTHGDGAQLNVILGGPFVSLTYSGTTSWRGNSADEDTTITNIALTNNIGQPIGTTDGSNSDPTGTRLFFASGPTVTSVKVGTIAGSTVRVDNPEGTATFGTSVNKPYFQYDGVLATNATYPLPETVRFVFSANVKTFSFGLRVSTPVQYEHGWITVASSTAPVLAPGQTATLTGTVYDVTGAVQADGITWSSSNTAVATVNASTGEVTAVGQGTATITATSTVNLQRIGTLTIVVDQAPEVIGTTPADGATLVASNSNIIITFSEAVIVSTNSFLLECPVSYDEPRLLTVSGSGTGTVTINPNADLPAQTICTVTVAASVVSDVDANDGPDGMALDYVFSFQVGP